MHSSNIYSLVVFFFLTAFSAAGQTTLFYDNCNTLGAWNNTGALLPIGTTGYNWTSVDPVIPPDDHTIGGNCFYVNGNGFYLEANAGNYLLYRLESPAIDLTGYDDTRLEFWMQMRCEVGNWDGGFVEVSRDGILWTQLDTELCYPYDGNMSQNPSSTPFYPYLTPAWWNPRTTWTRVVADISAFDNVSTFHVRFTFHSDEAAYDYGWTIDDIRVVSIARPEIRGNAVVIADNDLVPTPADFTDFGQTPIGTPIVRTFYIHNTGESPLTLTGAPYVTVTGAGFTVLNQPATNTIPPGGSVPFDIQFSPVQAGVINGTVNIPNSDDYSSCTPPNPYNFAIRGENLNTAPFTTSWINDTMICPNSGPVVFNFDIDDLEQALATILVLGNSSDQNVVDNSNIVFGAPGGSQTITITPTGQTGSTTITVILDDGQTVNNDSTFSFVLTLGDTIAPVAICQDVQVQLDANGNGTLTANQVDNGSTDNCGIQNISISQSQFTCTDVGQVPLTFTVEDIVGNTSTCQFTADVLPPPLVTSFTQSDYSGYGVSCNGGSDGNIDVQVSGGCSPYTFSWNHDPGITVSNATGLTAGNYVLTITDVTGQQEQIQVTLTEPDGLQDLSNAVDISCFGEIDGTIQLEASGGVLPYQYSGGPSITGLPAGTFNYIITDANNCTLPVSLTIAEPPSIQISGVDEFFIYCGENAFLDMTTTGGTGSFSFDWDNAGFVDCPTCEDATVTPNKSTVFTLTVTDDRGCSETYSVLVEVDCNVFIPNSFTPNLDVHNNVFYVYAGGVRFFEMRIFNRWGQEIFTSQDINIGWDGTYDNERAPAGVYAYDVYLVLPSGEERNVRGHVNLIR